MAFFAIIGMILKFAFGDRLFANIAIFFGRLRPAVSPNPKVGGTIHLDPVFDPVSDQTHRFARGMGPVRHWTYHSELYMF